MAAEGSLNTTEGSWLQLLLGGAPVSELHQNRQRLLAAAGPGERAAVEEDSEAALRLHALLEEKKRHSEELTVLNDLARRISTLRDTAGVLQEVTAQSRRLLAVDLAYIMLARHDGVLRIEVVDGSIGSTLRGVELAPGEGLGGQVITSGRALAVDDYLTEARIPHVPAVDVVAADERLGGVLAVPLQLGDESIGVLLAADRTTRRFTDREVTMLAALASHAAIAIHNARVFDRLRESADALAENNRRLQRSSELSWAAVDLYHQLTRSLVAGASLPEVAARLAQVIGGDVHVLDAHEQVLAAYRTRATTTAAGPELLRAALGDTSVERLAASDHPQAQGSWDDSQLLVVPVSLRDGVVGCVLAHRDRPFDEESVVLVESGASAIGMSLASERAVAEAERRSRGELLTALLAVDNDEHTVQRHARTAGADLDAVRSVAVFDLVDRDSAATADFASRAARELDAWAAEHGGRLVLLVPRLSAAAVVRRVEELADGPPPGLVGSADCAGGQRAVRESYEAARRTVDVLNALGRRAGAAVADELGAYRALFSHAGRDEAARFVTATLGTVLDHDRRHGRDLTRTLATFLDQAQHHARTCAELHIHANTLYGRLARLTALLGEDWRSPDRVLDLQLALRLHRVADRVQR